MYFTGGRISAGPRSASRASRLRSVKPGRRNLAAVAGVQKPPAGGRGGAARVEGRAEHGPGPGPQPWEHSHISVARQKFSPRGQSEVDTHHIYPADPEWQIECVFPPAAASTLTPTWGALRGGELEWLLTSFMWLFSLCWLRRRHEVVWKLPSGSDVVPRT